VEAAGRLLKMAAAGKRFLAGHNYSAHYTVEGVCQAEINTKLSLIRKAMAEQGLDGFLVPHEDEHHNAHCWRQQRSDATIC
jgi:hypothetical protein